jgi:predicted aspartyl protease
VRIEGKISQNNELIVDGSICKNKNKFQTSFKIDSGFIGYDIAIPANIASELSLSPSKVEKFSTVIGSVTLHAGNDAILCLGDKVYKISYVIHHGRFPLISINFLKNISEIMIIDFINSSLTVILK